jgi:hypothetical protein
MKRLFCVAKVALAASFGYQLTSSHAVEDLTQYFPDRTFAQGIESRLRYKGVLGVEPTNTGGRYAATFAANHVDTPVANARLNFVSLVVESPSNFGSCELIELPTPPNRILSGLVAPRFTIWEDTPRCWESGTRPPSQGRWEFADEFSFRPAVRRKTVDGSEFDASPLVQKRNGELWLTTFWAYRLGLVESQFEWSETRLRSLPEFQNWPRFAKRDEEFVLASLPPPIVEGEVTEYINTLDFPNAPGGVYFYASTDEDWRILDAKLPGRFDRTGKSFKHGGYVSVCRFYGSVSPGPNSHFYTANFDECEFIKSFEVRPRPSDKQQLNYEGKVFYANLPIPPTSSGGTATCPAASIPLYRAYNNSFGRNYDGNHRFSTNQADIADVVAKGWVDEGMVMCVPQ